MSLWRPDRHDNQHGSEPRTERGTARSRRSDGGLPDRKVNMHPAANECLRHECKSTSVTVE
jgi:hypothetical protein